MSYYVSFVSNAQSRYRKVWLVDAETEEAARDSVRASFPRAIIHEVFAKTS